MPIEALNGVAALTGCEPKISSTKGEVEAEGWSANFIAKTAFRS
jgi:hypothetical protein